MDLIKRLGLKGPLVVAPMAGGPTTVELVAEASKAGALGSFGAAYTKPDSIAPFVKSVRALTERPFAVNLFAPHPVPVFSRLQAEKAISATAPFRRELSLKDPTIAGPYEEDFSAQFEAVLRLQPAVISYVFGHLPKECVRAAREAGILLMGTATSVAEAEAIEAECDALVLQGFEAGGHRGIFDPTAEDPAIGAMDLLKQCRHIKRPLIAAGGIMNGWEAVPFLKAGAAAVQMGTAFLACREAGTSEPYRKMLRGDRITRTTRAFSGRFARGIENRFMRELDPASILPFPVQNKFTRDIRSASAAAGSADFLSLWAGTGHGNLWQGSAAELVATIFSEIAK
jgi:nitronate monooxygenase